ncbi:MAG TPA: glucosamine-6-phosphate deaminase [Chryseolinea sp.]|nr:glucosamine-6-phosphate deaminase [Chryseolinea sp.]
MKIIVGESYEAMSQMAADEVVQLLKHFTQPLICTASGDSPAGLYKHLVQKVNAHQADISDWFFISLDEWAGKNGTDEGSCRYYIDHQLFTPLQVKEDKICFFDGRASDLDGECEKAETFIRTNNGISAAIVGLGMNGHIGMNEPGTPASLRTHVAAIDPITQQVGQKYFKEPQEITRGITLGMATLMEAKHIILVVSGTHKAEIVRQVFSREISEDLPATLLRNHPNCTTFLDTDAASLLHS